jgi:predicted DNA-binding transcriptional regulator AlpA
MTKRLPELGALLPPNVQLDGKLVAWDENGYPDWTFSLLRGCQ